MNEEKTSIEEVVRHVWFWLIPIAGGLVDWANQMARGLKPTEPPLHVFLSITIHLLTAIFFAALAMFSAVHFGYSDWPALSVVGGGAAYLGTRIVDLANAVMKYKTGIDMQGQK